jgi:hypothetical protein
MGGSPSVGTIGDAGHHEAADDHNTPKSAGGTAGLSRHDDEVFGASAVAMAKEVTC